VKKLTNFFDADIIWPEGWVGRLRKVANGGKVNAIAFSLAGPLERMI
jgi:hypothetical protein